MEVRAVGRRFGDLLISVVLAVMLTTEVVLWPTGDQQIGVVLALLATLPLSLRRRSPVVAFLLTATGFIVFTRMLPGFDNDSFSLMLVFLLALYSVGRHARRVEAWIAGVLVAACVVGLMLTEASPYDVGDLAFALAFVGGPWAAGLAIRLRKAREQTLTDQNLELAREQEEKAAQAVAAERARIARDLHDVVSHAISVTVLQARGARRMLEVDSEEVRHALDAIEQTNMQALGDMRRLLSLLRDVDEQTPRPTRSPPSPSSTHLIDRLTAIRTCVSSCRSRARMRRRPPGCRPLGVPDHPGGTDQRDQARRSARERTCRRGPGDRNTQRPGARRRRLAVSGGL